MLNIKSLCLLLALCVIGAVNCTAQTVSVNPLNLTQAFQPEGSPVTASLTLSGGGSGSAVAISPATDSGGNWLTVTPGGGTVSDGEPLTISVAMDPSGLPDGTYTGIVTISGPSLANPIRVPVTITVGDPGPQLPASGLVNGASFQGGAISPGEIVALFGTAIGPPLPYGLQIRDGVIRSKLAGTRVWFDNTPAPLIYALRNQVAAIVPYDVAGKESVQVQVENMVVRTLPISLAVQDSAPAFFTADSSGKGPVAALNENGSYNSASNPASKGSIVVLYATGAGKMDPSVADGTLVSSQILPKPILPVRVAIGNQPAEVLYAGAAPQLVSGVLQVNVRVPDGIQAGAAPIVLTVGNVSSPDGCTISVR